MIFTARYRLLIWLSGDRCDLDPVGVGTNGSKQCSLMIVTGPEHVELGFGLCGGHWKMKLCPHFYSLIRH